MKKKITLLVTSVLIATGLSSTAANADALSDARAQLVTLQSQLTTANQAFTTQSAAVVTLTAQIAALDPATATAEQTAALNSQLAAATAAKLAAQQQISTLPAAIEAQIIQVRLLEIQAAQGQNCPTTWGVTQSDFSTGLDQGNFKFSSKVFDKVAAEPRNIVVSAKIELSSDNVNWTPGKSFSYNDYAGSTYYKTINFNVMYPATYMVRLGESKMRVTTVMAKDGCETLTVSTSGVTVPNSIVPNEKQTIDLLYATYLPGIQNFQYRDRLAAVYAKIKTDFPAAFNKGQAYYLNDGSQGNSEIFVYPRNKATCNGDINKAAPLAGQVCELGVYWTTGYIWKLVDIISATGGVDQVQAENEKLKAELTILQSKAMEYMKIVSLINNRVGNLGAQLENAQNNNEPLPSSFFTEAESIRSMATTYVSAQDYGMTRAKEVMSISTIDDAVRNLANQIMAYYSKSGSLLKINAVISQYTTQASSISPQSSAESQAALDRSQALLSQAKGIQAKAAAQIKSILTAIAKAKSQNISAQSLNDYYMVVKDLNNSVASVRNDIQNGQATAMKMLNSGNVSSVNANNWKKALSIYGEVTRQADIASNQINSLNEQLSTFQGESDDAVDTDGVEEDPTGTIKAARDNSGRYVITVITNQEESEVTVRATRAGQKTIVFNTTTNSDGQVKLRTTRKLAGWTVTLYFDDQVLARYKGIK